MLRVPLLLIADELPTLRDDCSAKVHESERLMLESASAVLFTCDTHADYCRQRYRLPMHEVIHPRPSGKDVAISPSAGGKMEGLHLVYAGAIAGRGSCGTADGHQVLHEVFSAFIDAGWTAHLFAVPPTTKYSAEYESIGCVLHSPVHYEALLSELGKYTAGLIAYSVRHSTRRGRQTAQSSLPGKTWDYLAAGIPTVCLDAGAAGRVTVDGGWGVECSLRSLAHAHETLPDIDEATRKSQVIEEDLDAFESLLGACGGSVVRRSSRTDWPPDTRAVYATPYEQKSGSRYKFEELLQKRFPGPTVFGRRPKLAAALLDGVKPELVVLFGDRFRHWEAATYFGIPYVLVEHDVASMREGCDESHARRERMMIESARAVIFPSEDYRDYCVERYDVPPHEVVHLRPLARDIDFVPSAKKLEGKHLVYAGGVLGRKYAGSQMGYRVMHEVFEAFLSAGWQVHVYTTEILEAHLPEYQEIGCNVHPSMPYPELLREMGRYTAGFLGYSAVNTPERSLWKAQTSRPNKTWDYLAAGIPTICVDAGAPCEIVVNGGWGVECTVEEIPSVYDRLPTITEELRQSQVMDKDLDRLEKLVNSALSRV